MLYMSADPGVESLPLAPRVDVLHNGYYRVVYLRAYYPYAWTKTKMEHWVISDLTKFA